MEIPLPTASQLPVLPRSSPQGISSSPHLDKTSSALLHRLARSRPASLLAGLHPELRAKAVGRWPLGLGSSRVQESPPSILLPLPNHSELLYRRSHAWSRPCPWPSQVAAGESVPHHQSARAVQHQRLTLRSLSLSDILERARPGEAGARRRPPVRSPPRAPLSGSQVDCRLPAPTGCLIKWSPRAPSAFTS